MEFFVNGGKIDVTLEAEKTVGDVLRSFELTCEENAAAVIGIKINGTKIEADTFDEVAQKDISELQKIEFEVVTKQSLNDAFQKLASLFKTLAQKMESVPVDLQSGKAKEATLAIAELADNIDLFCHTATLASLFPDTYKAIDIDGKPFAEFFADFTPILTQFEEALQSNDTVLVGDLAEYEICPRLQAVASALGKVGA